MHGQGCFLCHPNSAARPWLLARKLEVNFTCPFSGSGEGLTYDREAGTGVGSLIK
jgi:hypothetical protein